MARKALIAAVALCLAVAFVSFKGSVASAEGMKVGSVDLQRAMMESEYGKKSKGELEALYKQRRGEIEGRMARRDSLKAELEKQSASGALSEEKIKMKVDELEKISREIERFTNDAKEELQKAEREKITAGIRDVRKVVEDVSKEMGLSMVIDSEALVFMAESVDITDKVIERYNKQKGLSATPAPKGNR